MTENKNTEVIVAEENNEVTVTEVKKESKLKKAGEWVKKNGLKVITVGAAVGAGFLLGAHASGKSGDNNIVDDGDVIEADDYVVLEDTE